MVGGLGWTEMLIITGAVIIFLGGGKQLPQIASSLGEAIREFKRTANPEIEPPEKPEDQVGDADEK